LLYIKYCWCKRIVSRSKFIYIYSPDPQPAEEVADEQTEPAVVEEVQLEQAIYGAHGMLV